MFESQHMKPWQKGLAIGAAIIIPGTTILLAIYGAMALIEKRKLKKQQKEIGSEIIDKLTIISKNIEQKIAEKNLEPKQDLKQESA